jgi:hypothetical protein
VADRLTRVAAGFVGRPADRPLPEAGPTLEPPPRPRSDRDSDTPNAPGAPRTGRSQGSTRGAPGPAPARMRPLRRGIDPDRGMRAGGSARGVS